LTVRSHEAPAGNGRGLTGKLIDASRGLTFEALPAGVVEVAKQCVLDWLGVAIAGSSEPVVTMLADALLPDGARDGSANLVSGGRARARDAALVNGAAGHALDFDDVVWAMTGHPTAPTLPALLAVAEERGATGKSLLTAFVAAVETECRIGQALTDAHYEAGFHSTATLGAFGATAGCSHLLGLDYEQSQSALGVAATTAAGLKSAFGTMSKPMQVGNAASVGVLAAYLAEAGFAGPHDALERPQGFAATHTPMFDPRAARSDFGDPWYVRQVLFKYHAACFLTHSTIEGILVIRDQRGIRADQVEEVILRVDPGHLSVCNIQQPRTGLEAKFSLRHTAALAMTDGEASESAFIGDRINSPAIQALRDRVRVMPVAGQPVHTTDVRVRTQNGDEHTAAVDMAVPADDSQLPIQRARLSEKFLSLAAPVVGAHTSRRLLESVLHLEEFSSVAEITSRLTAETTSMEGRRG
jgi:2-methylcitrate dehydratase PrpD